MLPARVTVDENCEKFHVVVEPLVDVLELLEELEELEELDELELLDELLDELLEELELLELDEPLSAIEPEVETVRVAPQ